ncbi:MAG: hypothetical protein A3J93_01255 [Candidatus Magasanikbacteria bacterium RIFOXYC2_FULL_42_28]|uniref:t-SNARE coiled-coil homology domain-containing protein n=1 Tax=Candidatus Magasanikbacteria bacterium RIFOXYC2_FULL_42_28 TaxID=1798704 RepID=A0A1F6NXR7_9BACT|nr:MAG: hypothetical protein A3J93_01255 [Candidatus Magasanikbacteria bacterium RIFOXYC2_FULL_42_28]
MPKNKQDDKINHLINVVGSIKKSNEEVLGTVNELAEAVQLFATKVDQRFDGVDKRFDGVDKRFDVIEKRLTRVESLMVTKDYLDDKLADLRGDLVVMMRKEDTKVKTLAEILHKRKLISDQDLKSLVSMEPFAQLA